MRCEFPDCIFLVFATKVNTIWMCLVKSDSFICPVDDPSWSCGDISYMCTDTAPAIVQRDGCRGSRPVASSPFHSMLIVISILSCETGYTLVFHTHNIQCVKPSPFLFSEN